MKEEEDIKQQVIDEYQKGAPIRDIIKKFKIGQPKLRRFIKDIPKRRNNLTMDICGKKVKMSKLEIECCEMINKGFNIQQIKDKLHLNERQIMNRTVKYRVPLNIIYHRGEFIKSDKPSHLLLKDKAIDLCSKGHTCVEISEILGIHKKTASYYTKEVRKKLDIKSLRNNIRSSSMEDSSLKKYKLKKGNSNNPVVKNEVKKFDAIKRDEDAVRAVRINNKTTILLYPNDKRYNTPADELKKQWMDNRTKELIKIIRKES